MFVIEAGGRLVVIDCGVSFPTDETLGVDLVLPDFSYVRERADKCDGIVLTHGHEDHVGALSWLLRDVDAPVYGSPLTLGIAKRRLQEWGQTGEFVEVAARERRRIGSFDFRFFAMSHSIPDALSIVVGTSEGTIFYTSDFKLDETPIDGRRTDLVGLAEVAEEGIDLMLADSTNAETPGRTPSEAIVGDGLAEIFRLASGQILVACFASNLHRVQQVCDAAAGSGRKVAVVGRSMVANVEVGLELGHLRIPDDLLVEIGDISHLNREDLVIICTGSQGEPLSALSLIASGEHKLVDVKAGDSVILSASPIPGNESAVHRVINGFYKAGAEVYHSGNAVVHASGHAASEELAEMIMLMHPRFFVPVHGEYRQMAVHARIARSVSIPAEAMTIVEDGDVLELLAGKVRKGKSVTAGTILVDGLGVGDVGPVVLRDRRVLADDGILVCVVAIDTHTGEVLGGPDLISRGFVHVDSSRELLDEATQAVSRALANLEADRSTDLTAVKKTCRRALGEFVWKRTRRRPMILPVITEI